MDMLHIIRICAILIIFLLFSGLMMTRKMPAILALPVMAILMPQWLHRGEVIPVLVHYWQWRMWICLH